MVNTFSSGKLTVHRHGTLFLCTKIPFWYRVTAALEYRLSVDSQTIQRSVSALSAACFYSQQTRFRLLYIAFDPLLGSPSEGLFCDRFLSVTLFLFWRSASSLWSKPRVIICSMLQSLITLYISCVHSSSFEFLLHKYKTSIFWTSFEVTKTKQKSRYLTYA